MNTNIPQSHRDIRSRIDRELASGTRSNRLLGEKSPYLLQHAFNPVDWFPWGEEAFERARREDKVIFLSVGYSTCYWCHVMEREVFEKDAIASLMNENLVSIKVDREERPDIDQIYMAALVGMTGSGGWPMSVFMTPDRKPFFAATYLPPVSRHGRPGFPDLVQRIAELWSRDRAKVVESSAGIHEYLVRSASPESDPAEPNEESLDRACGAFESMYDAANAGFGDAPKFPRPGVFSFLFRYAHRTGKRQAGEMALATLRAMARGGICDQVGGGFHRYSTDERWHVPHFEKMLYDQAQLAISYIEAFQFTHDPLFAEIARKTLGYVQKVMTGPHGAFFSAEDAESALDPADPDIRQEGAFYMWSSEEFRGILDERQMRAAAFLYGVEEQGNVRPADGTEFAGKNILYVAHTIDETASQVGLTPDETDQVLRSARERLREARSKRPLPHLDDKILVSWNGLMISAFARAARVLNDDSLLRSAERSAEFLLMHLIDPESGKMFRRYRDGEAGIEATLSDYACAVQGLLDLYEASFDIRWLTSAITLTERQNALFFDDVQGGFFDTTESDKTLLVRTKEAYDGAEPSGNSVAIMNLLRLSSMIGREEYRTMAMRTFRCFGGVLRRHPHAVPQFLAALDYALSKPMQIIIAGRRDAPATKAMLAEISARFIPAKIVLLADGDEGQRALAVHVPSLGEVMPVGGAATAYVCENFACNIPTTDAAVFANALDWRGPAQA